MNHVIHKLRDSVGSEILLALWDFDRPCLEACDSPIEQLFYLALRCREFVGYIHAPSKGPQALPRLKITLQAKIEKFRCDFLIETPEAGTCKGVIVECDGHDFHERTKEQAARDRSRDRELQRLGYRVLRFTGSEIWNSPYRCASEAARHLIGEPYVPGNQERPAA